MIAPSLTLCGVIFVVVRDLGDLLVVTHEGAWRPAVVVHGFDGAPSRGDAVNRKCHVTLVFLKLHIRGYIVIMLNGLFLNIPIRNIQSHYKLNDAAKLNIYLFTHVSKFTVPNSYMYKNV